MNLAQLSHLLRDTSDRYGGIQKYLEAAGAIDKAASDFFQAQDTDALRDLNAAVARAWACRKELEGGKERVG